MKSNEKIVAALLIAASIVFSASANLPELAADFAALTAAFTAFGSVCANTVDTAANITSENNTLFIVIVVFRLIIKFFLVYNFILLLLEKPLLLLFRLFLPRLFRH